MFIKLLNVFVLIFSILLVSLLHDRNQPTFKSVEVHDILNVNELWKHTFVQFELFVNAIECFLQQFNLLLLVEHMFLFINDLFLFNIFIVTFNPFEHIFLSIGNKYVKHPFDQFLFKVLLNILSHIPVKEDLLLTFECVLKHFTNFFRRLCA